MLEGTFKTEVDIELVPNSFSSNKTLKNNAPLKIRLPNSVNSIVLRESLLSEAPFVTRSNKGFWRKWIDSPQFENLLASSYKYIATAIDDNGTINLDKLTDLKDSPFLDLMAKSFGEMFFTDRLFERDLFFSRLPEILSFMVLNALLISTPKHTRVFNSLKFREVLVDWSAEMIGGIRPSSTRLNKEWLFADTSDTPIGVVVSGSFTVQHADTGKQGLGPSPSTQKLTGSNKAPFLINHSPLVAIYLESSKKLAQSQSSVPSSSSLPQPLLSSPSSSFSSSSPSSPQQTQGKKSLQFSSSSSSSLDPLPLPLQTHSSSLSPSPAPLSTLKSSLKQKTTILPPTYTPSPPLSSTSDSLLPHLPHGSLGHHHPPSQPPSHSPPPPSLAPLSSFSTHAVRIQLTHTPSRPLMSLSLSFAPQPPSLSTSLSQQQQQPISSSASTSFPSSFPSSSSPTTTTNNMKNMTTTSSPSSSSPPPPPLSSTTTTTPTPGTSSTGGICGLLPGTKHRPPYYDLKEMRESLRATGIRRKMMMYEHRDKRREIVGEIKEFKRLEKEKEKEKESLVMMNMGMGGGLGSRGGGMGGGYRRKGGERSHSPSSLNATSLSLTLPSSSSSASLTIHNQSSILSSLPDSSPSHRPRTSSPHTNQKRN